MAQCEKCGRNDPRISAVLRLCAECIRTGDQDLMNRVQDVHAHHRREFGLPPGPPRTRDGITCRICRNACQIGDGEAGYCGIRVNRDGRLSGGTPEAAAVSWYHDPLPTNCVADWVCPGGTGTGYPKWAHRDGPEYGYANLAVFYEACTFDCLFCQNWHFRERAVSAHWRSSEELAAAADSRTGCICFFGGDPTCQLPHALAAARSARQKNPGRILRICWETNGSMDPALLDEMQELSLESGGCVKFDLKAFDAKLHRALCGVENRRTLENFARAAGRIKDRQEPPPLVASTLLVPQYVDTTEVTAIASFIANLDVNIPYSLLGFHGDFLMTDLPATSREHAQRCVEAAEAAGLKRVRIGNVHILGSEPC